MFFNKKGQTSSVLAIPGNVWALIIAGLIVVVGVLVLANFQTASYDTITNASEMDNFTVADDLSVWNLTTGLAQFLPTCSGVSAIHGTNSSVIDTSWYSVDGCTLQIASTVPDSFNNTMWNFTYRLVYRATNDASDAVGVSITNISAIPDWLPIVVVVLMAGLVVALIQIYRKSKE